MKVTSYLTSDISLRRSKFHHRYLTEYQKDLIREFSLTDESIRGTVRGVDRNINKKGECHFLHAALQLAMNQVTIVLIILFCNLEKRRKENERDNSEKPDAIHASECKKTSSENATSAEFVKGNSSDEENESEQKIFNMKPEQAKNIRSVTAGFLLVTLYLLFKTYLQG